MVMFRKKLKKTITRGKYIATTYALALLFCISLSSIILNMQREEMDEFVKEKSVLHGFMALAVDFRVHSAFINFSMLKEFVERRFPEGLEVYDIEAEHERGEPLFVSSYGAVDSSALTCKGPGCTNPVYPGPEPYMVCKMCGQACCKLRLLRNPVLKNWNLQLRISDAQVILITTVDLYCICSHLVLKEINSKRRWHL